MLRTNALIIRGNVLQNLNPFLLETHSYPFILFLCTDALLIKVDGRLIPLHDRGDQVSEDQYV
jgi:hypothetical protein